LTRIRCDMDNYPNPPISKVYWIYCPDDKGKWLIVPRAYKAVIMGYEAFDLFYHRHLGKDYWGTGSYLQLKDGWWCISEGLSGYAVVTQRAMCNTRQEAKEAWWAMRPSAEDIWNAIEGRLADNGPSPRYSLEVKKTAVFEVN